MSMTLTVGRTYKSQWGISLKIILFDDMGGAVIEYKNGERGYHPASELALYTLVHTKVRKKGWMRVYPPSLDHAVLHMAKTSHIYATVDYLQEDADDGGVLVEVEWFDN